MDGPSTEGRIKGLQINGGETPAGRADYILCILRPPAGRTDYILCILRPSHKRCTIGSHLYVILYLYLSTSHYEKQTS